MSSVCACTEMVFGGGETVEILAFSHLTSLNIASYNVEDGTCHFFGPAVIDSKEFTEDNSRLGVYLSLSMEITSM